SAPATPAEVTCVTAASALSLLRRAAAPAFVPAPFVSEVARGRRLARRSLLLRALTRTVVPPIVVLRAIVQARPLLVPRRTLLRRPVVLARRPVVVARRAVVATAIVAARPAASEAAATAAVPAAAVPGAAIVVAARRARSVAPSAAAARSALLRPAGGRARAHLDLAARVDVDDRDGDLVADVDHVARVLDVVVGHLAHVQQRFLARHQLDERAEVLHLDDGRLELVADVDFLGEGVDVARRLLDRLLALAGDHHLAEVVDLDVGAGALLDHADVLAARADQRADLVDRDHAAQDARRVLRNRRPPGRDDRVHDPEDVEPALARLRQRVLHHGEVEAADLHVHLHRGDAVDRAGDLEVHVAVVVLTTQDVGEDLHLAALGDQTHRDARDRRLERHARVHHRQRSGAHGRHRGRAV